MLLVEVPLNAGRCHYCRCEMPPSDVTRDHVIPRSLRRVYDSRNLVRCCQPCNVAKGSQRVVDCCGLCDELWRLHGQGVNATPIFRSALLGRSKMTRHNRLGRLPNRTGLLWDRMVPVR